MSEVVAVIPARGGSRSLPRKNTRLLGGHPLVAWSVAAARSSRRVSRVLVSTDDVQIRELGIQYGAEAPFLRPSALAGDDTPDLPVFEHVLDWLQAEGRLPEVIVQLRPTSPLRHPGWVDEAVEHLLADPRADCVRTVVPPGANPYKMWRRSRGRLTPLFGSLDDELFNCPRQRLPEVLWQTGHIDAFRARTVRERRSLTGRRILPLLVDPRYAVDIDTLEQWTYAEWLLARGGLSLTWPSIQEVLVSG